MPRVAHNFRFFADFLVDDLHHPDFETRGHRNHVSWDPAGVVRAHLAVERPADARHLEGCTRARRRQHGRAQAVGMVATDRIAAGRHRPRGRPARRRLQRGAGIRRRGRRRARSPSRTSPHLVHRIGADGQDHRGRRRGQPDARVARARRQVTLRRVRRRRPRPGRDARRSSSTTTPARSACPAPGCWSRSRSATSSSNGSSSRASALRQGDPRDEGTDIGPAIHPRQFDKVDGFVQRAKAGGATVLLGGGPQHRPRRPLLPADPVHRRRPGERDLDRRRSSARPRPAHLRRRGRGDPHGQRFRVRPGRHGVHRRPANGPSG